MIQVYGRVSPLSLPNLVQSVKNNGIIVTEKGGLHMSSSTSALKNVSSVPIRQETGWVPELLKMLRRGERCLCNSCVSPQPSHFTQRAIQMLLLYILFEFGDW